MRYSTETDIDNFLNNTFVGDDEPTAAPTPETNSQAGSAKYQVKAGEKQALSFLVEPYKK